MNAIYTYTDMHTQTHTHSLSLTHTHIRNEWEQNGKDKKKRERKRDRLMILNAQSTMRVMSGYIKTSNHESVSLLVHTLSPVNHKGSYIYQT